MEAETYDPKEVLEALPLVKDVKPHHLHDKSRRPLVGVNGDLRRATPASGLGGRPDLLMLPIAILRRLMQHWPEGESVTVTRGTEDLQGWRDGKLQKTGERRYVELSAGTFRVLLYDAVDFCFRPESSNPRRRGWTSTWVYSTRYDARW